MTKCAPVWRLFLFVVLAFSFAGCSQFRRSGVADEKDPHYLDGKRRQSGMDWDGAIRSFERALQSNPNNASAHFELGLIYDRKKNDPAAAIYHYQKHLTLRTNSPNSDRIVEQIGYCKRELAKTHSYTLVSRDVQHELERLIMTNKLLAARIDFLEGELARGPRYLTNYVTNFVKVPEFGGQGSRLLTQPTEIVDPPVQDDPPIEEPASAPAERTTRRPETTRSTASTSSRSTQRASVTPKTRSENTAAPARIKTVHTVRPGETLQVLASRYGVSAAQLRAANPGLGRGTRAGQKITIPAK